MNNCKNCNFGSDFFEYKDKFWIKCMNPDSEVCFLNVGEGMFDIMDCPEWTEKMIVKQKEIK